MDALYFEDVEVSDRCTAGPYLITKSEIIQFAKQYDPVPENIDEEAAARSIFGGLTACSPHTFSIYILLTTRLQPKHPLSSSKVDRAASPRYRRSTKGSRSPSRAGSTCRSRRARGTHLRAEPGAHQVDRDEAVPILHGGVHQVLA